MSPSEIAKIISEWDGRCEVPVPLIINICLIFVIKGTCVSFLSLSSKDMRQRDSLSSLWLLGSIGVSRPTGVSGL